MRIDLADLFPVFILIMIAAMMLLVAVFCGLAMFTSHPTGGYYVDGNSALEVKVWQEVKFGMNRCLYTGTPQLAWQLYFNLSSPPPTLNLNKTADLQWLSQTATAIGGR